MSILGIRRAKLDVLHATDHLSQQSRRYGVLPGHSASQAGCASRHVTPITVVQAVRCPSRAFGEPSRILLHNPHVTAVPVVNWQGQDEMCCPVCCSLVTGCCLGQGWAFRCAGAYFTMFHYDQLSQQEQADALLPAHVFPVTGFGTLPETGVKVLSTKLVACSAWCHAALGNGSVCARATSGTAAGRPVHVASAVL